ncbi:MAG: hypothetical protein J0H34_20845 [Rhizobiales bacterium]|nr:hypothetical protein [Hyphomicrobiales bacterium]
MWGGREFSQAVLAFAGGIFACLIALVLLSADRIPSWCGQQDMRCLRDWIGALSGWAATVAAGATIFWLARQLHVARQQTEFIVGDADPTASLFDPRERNVDAAFSSRLQVVNWNRNPILIRNISIPEDQGFVFADVRVEDTDPVRRNILAEELKRGRMFVPGWLDRSRAPALVEFSITVEKKAATVAGEILNDLARVPLRVQVCISIVGATHRDLDITVERPDALTLVS